MCYRRFNRLERSEKHGSVCQTAVTLINARGRAITVYVTKLTTPAWEGKQEVTVGVNRRRCYNLKRQLFIVEKHVFISCHRKLWLRAEPGLVGNYRVWGSAPPQQRLLRAGACPTHIHTLKSMWGLWYLQLLYTLAEKPMLDIDDALHVFLVKCDCVTDCVLWSEHKYASSLDVSDYRNLQ